MYPVRCATSITLFFVCCCLLFCIVCCFVCCGYCCPHPHPHPLYIYIYIYILCFISAQNFEITCPSSGFKVGEPATVTCTVNKTVFETTCLRPPTLVKFHFTPSNGVKNEWCTANYSICNGTGVADQLCGKCSCGCKEGNEDLIVHRLEFIPTSEHAAGRFSCAVVCLQNGNLPPLTKNNCDRVTVGKLIVF